MNKQITGRQFEKDLINLLNILKKQASDNKPILYIGRFGNKVILPEEVYNRLIKGKDIYTKIKLSDVIYYESIKVIYYLESNPLEPEVLDLFLEYQDDIETYQDIITYIGKPISSMLIIAENGLSGIILRWNNVEGLFQVGTTRGYA